MRSMSAGAISSPIFCPTLLTGAHSDAVLALTDRAGRLRGRPSETGFAGGRLRRSGFPPALSSLTNSNSLMGSFLRGRLVTQGVERVETTGDALRGTLQQRSIEAFRS